MLQLCGQEAARFFINQREQRKSRLIQVVCASVLLPAIFMGGSTYANVLHRPKNDAPPEPALEAKLLLCGAQILGQHRGIFSFRTSVRRLHTTHLAASQSGAYVRIPLVPKGLVGSILT